MRGEFFDITLDAVLCWMVSNKVYIHAHTHIYIYLSTHSPKPNAPLNSAHTPSLGSANTLVSSLSVRPLSSLEFSIPFLHLSFLNPRHLPTPVYQSTLSQLTPTRPQPHTRNQKCSHARNQAVQSSITTTQGVHQSSLPTHFKSWSRRQLC